MQLLVIDVETTGLDPERHQVLELAAIYFDTADITNLPAAARGTLQAHGPELELVVYHDELVGQARALAMNAPLLARLQNGAYPQYAYARLCEFARQYHRRDAGPLIAAGKNVAGFDLPFIRRMDTDAPHSLPLHHRTIDPGSLYTRPDDNEPPSLAECCRRAGISADVTHRAIDDARLTLNVIARALATYQED